MASIAEWTEHTGAAYPYLNADETLLKTMIRANTGLIVLKDATIVGKWSAADLPRDEQLHSSLEASSSLSISPEILTSRRLVAVLCMFLPMLMLIAVDRKHWRRRSDSEKQKQV